MAGYPASRESDPEEVSTALEVGGAQWARGELADALKWLRKAVDAAFEAGMDGRGVELSKVAVELSPGPRKPTLAVGSVPPPVPQRARSVTAPPPAPPVTAPTASAPPMPPPRVPMPSAPQRPLSRSLGPPAPAPPPPPPPPPPPTVVEASIPSSNTRRTSAAGTRRNTKGPRTGDSVRPPPLTASAPVVATPPAAAPAPRAASGVAPLRPAPPKSPMRGNTLEVELEEATDSGPMPPPPLPKRLTPAPDATANTEVRPRPEEVIGDQETTRVLPSPAASKNVLAGLRVGVSRGAAGVVVRVLDGEKVRTGEVEALLVGTGPSKALLDLFGLK